MIVSNETQARTGTQPKGLFVLFDAKCGLCQRCRAFLARQPAHVPLRFIPLQDPDLESRFPGVSAYQPEQEIVVVADTGEVYTGGRAWLMCLWALEAYRPWSYRLSNPALLPMVRKFCSLVSSNRIALSALLAQPSPMALAAHLDLEPEPICDGEECH